MEGAFVIDAFDGRSHELLWHGFARARSRPDQSTTNDCVARRNRCWLRFRSPRAHDERRAPRSARRPGVVPPSAAERDAESGRVLQTLRDRLDVADLRLQVLAIGDEHLQVGRYTGLVIGLDQLQRFFRGSTASV